MTTTTKSKLRSINSVLHEARRRSETSELSLIREWQRTLDKPERVDSIPRLIAEARESLGPDCIVNARAVVERVALRAGLVKDFKEFPRDFTFNACVRALDEWSEAKNRKADEMYAMLAPFSDIVDRVEAVKVLRKARRLIKAGWTQGMMRSHLEAYKTRCYCAAGAIREVLRFHTQIADYRGDLLNFAVEALERFTDGENLTEWNDKPGRSQNEVLLLFGKAAREVEKGRLALLGLPANP